MRGFVIGILLVIASGTVAQQNTLYYFSIGNAHYTKGERDDRVKKWFNLPSAINSARYVTRYLSAYGTGRELLSAEDKPLTRQEILDAFDAVMNTALEKHLSTIFFYYCGHGFSDAKGNVFIVPGDHRFIPGDGASLKSLVSLAELHILALNKINERYTPTPEEQKAAQDESLLGNLLGLYLQSGGDEQKFKSSLLKIAKEVAYENFSRPYVVFLMDCCSENDNVVNYQQLQGMMPGSLDQIQQLIDLVTPPNGQGYQFSLEAVKNGMWLNNHQTIYSSFPGTVTRPVASPLYNDTKKVGPICRRMINYLSANGRISFQLKGFVNMLVSPNTDPLTAPAYIENLYTPNMFNNQQNLPFVLKDLMSLAKILNNYDNVYFIKR